jgi:hypothetical protein
MTDDLPAFDDAVVEEALAMDAAITEDRSEEEQARRVEAVAMLVAAENLNAPSEEEVEALYTGEPLPEPEHVDEVVEATVEPDSEVEAAPEPEAPVENDG